MTIIKTLQIRISLHSSVARALVFKPGVVSSILAGGLHFYNSRGTAYVIIKTAFFTICKHLITSDTCFKIQEKLYSYVTL